MKTSILISSIAALCLLITFAEAPHRYVEDKMDLASTDNISIVTTKRATMLPGVVIIPDRNMEAAITLPVVPAEEFSYLKFEVNEYMEVDASNPDEDDILPETTEVDFSYLKFNVSDYYTSSYLTSDEMAVNGLEYPRFNVNDYIKNSSFDLAELEEMPLDEVETTNEFSYLRFDLTKYYNSDDMDTDKQFEIPEE